MGSYNNLDKFAKDLGKRVNELNGLTSFDKLFPTSFMTKNTGFSSFNELLNAGNFEVETQEDFDAISEDEFNEFLKKTTKFKSWKEMKELAGGEYIKNNLKL